MKDKLILSDDDGSWRIVWFLAEEQEQGAFLGDTVYSPHDLTRAKPEDRDHVAATLAARASEGSRHDSGGYHWPTRREALAALKECRAAIAGAKSGAPWPDWAIKAKAAGWKAPKGWTP